MEGLLALPSELATLALVVALARVREGLRFVAHSVRERTLLRVAPRLPTCHRLPPSSALVVRHRIHLRLRLVLGRDRCDEAAVAARLRAVRGDSCRDLVRANRSVSVRPLVEVYGEELGAGRASDQLRVHSARWLLLRVEVDLRVAALAALVVVPLLPPHFHRLREECADDFGRDTLRECLPPDVGAD